jgi:MraZ protein
VFRGDQHLTIDAKGRMAIPTKYRETLLERYDGKLVVTADPESCLLLFTLQDWEEFERNLLKAQKEKQLPRLKKLKRFYIGQATELEMDGNGRILLPSTLRKFAGLDKKIVMCGQGDRFEIWNEQDWNEQLNDDMDELKDLAALF